MVSAGLQMVGAALGVIGWVGVIVACVLPQWKVTAFVGQSIVTAQSTWEGIWMTCVSQSTGQMQCKIYDSMLALSQSMQAARALMVISLLTGIVAILLAVAGGKCTNCVENERTKSIICVAAGVMFIVSGVLCLIPVCWTANGIIRNFHSAMTVGSQKRELGASLFIGWGASGLLIVAGALLCMNCPKRDSYSAAKYTAPPSRTAGSKDYV